MKRSEVIDGLRYIKNWKCDGDAEMYKVIVSAIKMLEQPEIVRCGECVKQYKPTCPFGVWINTPNDGHCHWAERRIDADD